jgi:uncharacterized protein (DUF58 family)
MSLQEGIQVHRDRIPIPTTLTVGLAGLGMAVALLFGWKGALGFDLALLLGALLDSTIFFRNAEISAVRKCPDYVSQGISQEIEILLRNKGEQSRRVKVRDQTPLAWEPAPALKGVVPGRSLLKLHYRATPPERGVYRFGDIHMRVEGRLGLAARPIRVSASEEVKVFPRLQPLRYPDLVSYRRTSRQWGLMRARWRGEGREFEALREYVEGDDPRKIHWKATARLDRPIVQEFQPEKNQNVVMVLDAGRLMCALSEGKTKLDHALDSSVQLAHAALAGGDQPGVLAFADQVISFVAPKRSPDQLQMILEATVSLKPLLVEPQYEQAFLWLRFRLRRRSLIVIFTDLLDEVASENLLDAVALLKPRHLPLCIAIRESEWDRLMSRSPSTVEGVYQRSVLLESLRQRNKALKSLLQKGSLALDLPPSKLSFGTLERYLEVKRKGLL